MAISAPSPPAPPDRPLEPGGRHERAPGIRRPLGPRRQLPGGRAVVGGLLVTLAAIGTFVAATSAGSGSARSVVVASRPVAAGEHLTAADLRSVPADLPGEVHATSFGSVDGLVGAVALAPIDADQVIARAEVSLDPGSDGARTHDLSFALDRDRALNGRIQPGELVDLVATFGSGSDATTEVVVRRVRVADLDVPSGSSAGPSAKVTITLAFPTEDEVLLAANALEVAKVTLSRSTGTPIAQPAAPTPSRDGDTDGDAPGSTVRTPPPSTAPPADAEGDDP